MDDFHASQPIFVQIRQRLIEMILRGSVGEGEALPSVRQIAADLSVNPLTVTKAFEALVDIGVVEKRRGLGMFVAQGAHARLLAHEREKFLKDDWPRIAAQIRALGLDLDRLLTASSTPAKPEGPTHE
ncbi:GntR family transcriptional regulator [Devosia sp. PTR5]|uniref:GntR family transcriptional regulator n=1 Tax=Devosia oryzisoli TaxID=2774138 RepID=A0A927FWM2_9HYPH|nr:GntR family transcriptional regulator [Devosia oryzisoli]MBD8066233.1 GntR family transcriptional regulator [Devosia oryzisoli]